MLFYGRPRQNPYPAGADLPTDCLWPAGLLRVGKEVLGLQSSSVWCWTSSRVAQSAGPICVHDAGGCGRSAQACQAALASSLKSFQPPEQYLGRSLHCSNQKRSSEFLNLIPFNMSFCFWVGHRLWLSKSSARPEASWNGPCTSMTSKDWKASGFLDKH